MILDLYLVLIYILSALNSKSFHSVQSFDIYSVLPSTMDIAMIVTQGNETLEAKLLVGPSICGAVLGSIFCAVTLFGNIVTIIVIAINTSLRKPVFLPVATLAANDLLFSLMSMLFIHTYIKQAWTLGITSCKILHMASSFTLLTSLLHTIYLMLLRYIAIVHPAYSEMLKSWCSAIAASVTCCLLSFIASIGNIMDAFKKSDSSHDVHVIFNPLLMTCRKYSVDFHPKALLFSLLGLALVCSVLFLYCYIHCYIVLRKNRINFQAHLTDAAEEGMRKQEVMLLKLMAVITVFFLVTFFTRVVFSIMGMYGVHISQYGYVVATLTQYLSPASNWIIYGITTKSFRAAFKRLFTGTFRCTCNIPVNPVHIDQGVVMQMVNV